MEIDKVYLRYTECLILKWTTIFFPMAYPAVGLSVPQGSYLEPLLFLVFVNGITMFLNDLHYLLYADDLKIYQAISNSGDKETLQVDLSLVRVKRHDD